MKIFLIAIVVISALLMVGVILLQQGKGASLGAAFGSGAQGGLAGESGKANFLTRTTAVLVTIFFLACLALTLLFGSTRDDRVRELLEDAPIPIESRADDGGDNVGGDDGNNANNNADNAADDDRPIAREE